MMKRTLMIGAAILAGTVAILAAPVAPAASPGKMACGDVKTAKFADVTITAADDVAPGKLWADEPAAGPGPPRQSPKAGFCRVQGVIEKEIGFELWLPLREAWNGKFLGTGVGGDAGAFNMQDVPRGVDRGYAAATTDSGHKAADANWMMGDPARLPNFEYRAHHLLAVKGKEIASAYYASAPKYSYFVGCSGGGRQGLKEMQKFPADYDGVLVGAGGPKTPEMTTRRMWEILEREKNVGLMSREDWALVQKTQVASCDRLDGVEDGVAEDPRRCSTSVASLACTGEKTPACLTKQQIALADKLYGPMTDEDGRKIDDGLLPGVLVDSGRSRLAPATFGQALRKKTDWSGADFSVKNDLPAIWRAMPDLAADNADLRPFAARGGKFIQYSGWVDPAVAAKMIVTYHDDVAKTVGGKEKADSFSRLYMLPGVLHCGGGAGADQMGGAGRDAPIVDEKHDLLTALEQWVEKGRAPGPMIATKLEKGATVRTRLICPYPQSASYKGGDPNVAASFECTRSGAKQ